MRKGKRKLPTVFIAKGWGSLAGSAVKDMLRYDRCTLVSEQSDAEGNTEAVLSYPYGKKPTIERWKSYGWDIAPYTAGATCPDCSSRLFYRNPSSGNLHCAGCNQRALAICRLDNSAILSSQIQE